MKILALCNLYPAEVTFVKEMQANPKYSIVPAFDPGDGIFTGNPIYKNIAGLLGGRPTNPDQKSVTALVRAETPDLIIVRCWTRFANLRIPKSMFWKIESLERRKSPDENLQLLLPNQSAGYFCTQNKEEIPVYQKALGIPVAYLPRGVCPSWESPKKKTVDIVSCGTATVSAKVKSFKMLVSPLTQCFSPERLHVYVSVGAGNVGWLKDYLRPIYMVEDAPTVIGSAKVFVSPVATRFDPGIFSQKSLQAMACRTLVLTQYYPGLEDIVGPDGENILYAKSSEEAVDKVKFYLSHDKEREEITERGYKFVHSEYNYTKVFENALKTLGII